MGSGAYVGRLVDCALCRVVSERDEERAGLSEARRRTRVERKKLLLSASEA